MLVSADQFLALHITTGHRILVSDLLWLV